MVALIQILITEKARSRSILGIFTDLFNVGCEKGVVTDDPYIFGLCNLKDGVTIRGDQEFSLNMLSLRCQLDM